MSRRLALVWLVALGLPSIAQAEYLVSPGDTIEVRVAGVVNLSQRAQVQQDGTVALPGVGDIRVGGLGLADMRSTISATLASKVVRQRAPDGQELITAIQPDDVSIDIAEYRPVYVGGDVLNPGQQVFRLGMTVRQAISLSGGYSSLHSHQLGPVDLLDVQSQYASVVLQLAKQQAHAARLQAELDGKKEITPIPPGDVPVPAATLAELLGAEAESLRISAGQYELQKASLLSAIERSKDQLAKLQLELGEEEKGLKSDQEDFSNLAKPLRAASLPVPASSTAGTRCWPLRPVC